jgi:uncharacterized protein (DUF983 family)
MNFKRTKLYSILNNRCPHCHEGRFFKTDNPFSLRTFDKMNMRCPVCNEGFEFETGFYYGAMYVSYALTVAFGVFEYIIFSFLIGLDAYAFLIIFAVSIVLLMTVFYRTSRLIWINFFVKFKGK